MMKKGLIIYSEKLATQDNKQILNVDYAAYKDATEDALPKFKINGALIKDFKENLMPVIIPLLG